MKFKKYLLLLFLVSITLYSRGQSGIKDFIFIAFDESNEAYFTQIDDGKKIKEKSFVKSKLSNGKIQFFIEGLLFVHDPSEMQANDLLKSSYYQECKLWSPKEILNYIDKIKSKYPLGYKFPSKEFPRLIIVDSSNEKKQFYEVKWQPYQK